MVWIHKRPDIDEKLCVLSRDSQYDLGCACGTSDATRRHGSEDHRWVYPVNAVLGLRGGGRRIRSIEALGAPGKTLMKARQHVKFGY